MNIETPWWIYFKLVLRPVVYQIWSESIINSTKYNQNPSKTLCVVEQYWGQDGQIDLQIDRHRGGKIMQGKTVSSDPNGPRIKIKLDSFFNILLRLITVKLSKVYITSAYWRESTPDRWYPLQRTSNMGSYSCHNIIMKNGIWHLEMLFEFIICQRSSEGNLS